MKSILLFSLRKRDPFQQEAFERISLAAAWLDLVAQLLSELLTFFLASSVFLSTTFKASATCAFRASERFKWSWADS